MLILCGIPLIHYLNLELNPRAISSSISVRFSWSSAEPRIIEQEATSKLEALFARVNGVRNISSTSGNGSGNINLTLDKEADPDAVRFEISTLIRQVWPEMPAGARFPGLSINSSGQENRRPLLTYKLNAPQSPPLVQQYADNNIKPVLSQIAGINKIDIYMASRFVWSGLVTLMTEGIPGYYFHENSYGYKNLAIHFVFILIIYIFNIVIYLNNSHKLCDYQ